MATPPSSYSTPVITLVLRSNGLLLASTRVQSPVPAPPLSWSAKLPPVSMSLPLRPHRSEDRRVPLSVRSTEAKICNARFYSPDRSGAHPEGHRWLVRYRARDQRTVDERKRVRQREQYARLSPNRQVA